MGTQEDAAGGRWAWGAPGSLVCRRVKAASTVSW